MITFFRECTVPKYLFSDTQSAINDLIYPQERSEELKARLLTSENLLWFPLGWKNFQVQGLTTTSVCHHLETPGQRGMLPGLLQKSFYQKTHLHTTHSHMHTMHTTTHIIKRLLIKSGRKTSFFISECVIQPVGVSWRFLLANQESSSTLPTSWMALWQERAGLDTGGTAPSVWRHRIGLMLSTRYDGDG